MNIIEPKYSKVIGVVGLMVIVAAIGAGFILLPSKPTASVSGGPGATPITDTASDTASNYKDGSYSANGTYDTPGGPETVSVQLTIKGNIIYQSSVSTTGHDLTGKTYQDKFVKNYKAQVDGKRLQDIHLSRVSGSSLTSGGFNAAVDAIKAQAKA